MNRHVARLQARRRLDHAREWTAALLTALFVGLFLGRANAQNADAVWPTNSVVYSINPAVSTAIQENQQMSTGPANLYNIYFTNTGSAAGFLLVFDAAAVPADGAVTPKICVPVGTAPAVVSVNLAPGPMMQFNTGIAAAASTTGCFTKTTSATVEGFFSASFK